MKVNDLEYFVKNINPPIIGFIGVVGSGKDYNANRVMSIDPSYKKYSFADEVRDFVWLALGWEPKNNEEYELFKLTKIEFGNMSLRGRDMLINVGNGLRQKDPDVWINYWLKKIPSSFKNEKVVVSDVRYYNEVKAIHGLGGKVIFCYFISDKYNDKINSESERMSQKLISLGYDDMTVLDPLYMSENITY